MSRCLIALFLFACAGVAFACETEAMKGYEGPCAIYGQIDTEYRYFYTRPKKGPGVTKKWDVETGRVIEEGSFDFASFPPIANAGITVRTATDARARYLLQKYGGANDLSRITYRREEADGRTTLLKGWFTINDGFYPVDHKTAWVFQHHDNDRDSDGAVNSVDSKVGALYLVDLDTGNRLRTIIFDKRDSPAEQRLREYIDLKLQYAREQFTAQVARLQSPEIFLLRPDNAVLLDTIFALDERLLEMRSADRVIVYDTIDRRPVSISHNPSWIWTINSKYAPEKTYRIRAGLGTSPQLSDQASPIKGKFLIGRLTGSLVVVADNKGNGEFDDIEIWDTVRSARLRKLHGGKIRQWKISDSGRYLYIHGGGKHYVYDTDSGDQVIKQEVPLILAADGMINTSTADYTPFATMQPVKLAWKPGKDYRYKRFQGQYILSVARGQGIEVFDISANRYLTPMPLDPGLHDLNDSTAFRGMTMAYFPARNQLAVAMAGGVTGFASKQTQGKSASGYLLDLTTYDLEPINVNALPWEDPLLALREGSRENDRIEEERRREAALTRERQIRLQEEALMAQVEEEVSKYPAERQLALFLPEGPLGPYVGNERKARALEKHMAWWAQPNHHSNSYGLEGVPFAFLEDILPHLSEPWAAQVRSVLPGVRFRQLEDAKKLEQHMAVERMKENFAQALRNYRAPPGAPSTLDRIHDYQRQHYLYGKAARDACSAANPCGPGNQFRTDGR